MYSQELAGDRVLYVLESAEVPEAPPPGEEIRCHRYPRGLIAARRGFAPVLSPQGGGGAAQGRAHTAYHLSPKMQCAICWFVASTAAEDEC